MDETPASTEAIRYAGSTFPDADLLILHVAGVAPRPITKVLGDHLNGIAESTDEEFIAEPSRERAAEIFENAKAVLSELQFTGTLETELTVGSPARTILQRATEVDGIVMGTGRRSGTARMLAGSVAETVVQEAEIPVTVVKARSDH